ncbi:VCBS repeat-containing protein [Pseudenhygromyxa sp. WMMC2535]|uniref:FG-GAP repeat domain-containing protein n=1 Tax=Pseudenhygromyxa sp. WMMC2535 TaxID=2712867 RepID=UPI001552C55D|nr:VCBS repeat-containing protein [Pseudenhygromyxa sp. WMMC2535]NVB40829.1 VCBS repeat-containing protein [Pseudenhygromyxa sp. WMMC2535]
MSSRRSGLVVAALCCPFCLACAAEPDDVDEFTADAPAALDPDSPATDEALRELEAARPPEQAAATPVTDDDTDARAMLIGDFDGDGSADIFRADWNGNGRQYNLALLSRETSWARWAGPLAILLGGDTRQLYVGDFDGDGSDDIFRADQGGDGSQYNMWFSPDGAGGWTWRAGPGVILGGDDRHLYVGDFNGDGRDDLLLAHDESTDQNRIYLSQGDGGWTTWSSGLGYWLGGDDREVLIADFDGDGDDDILRADGGGDGREYNRLALSKGNGGWSVHFNSPPRILKGGNRALYVGDFDGDGAADLFRADWNGDGTQYNAAMPSHGDGSWGYWAGIALDMAPESRALHVGDFDGDGRDDILLADWSGNGRDDNRVIRSLGGGAWGIWEQPKWWLGGSNREIHVANFDLDGRADILRADWNADGKAYNRVDHSKGDGSWTHGPNPAIWLGGSQGVGLPEIPTILRAVTGYEDGEYVAPHVPPVRTSNDGRIATYLKPNGANRKFALITPEVLDGHLVHQDPGVSVFSDTTLTANAAFDGDANANGHHLSLCDGSSPLAGLAGQDDLVNPRACGQDDCYDLHTITTVELANDQKQVWATPITVRVANPKTAAASITSITPGTPVAGPIWDVKEAFEPMFTADGRLFVFRVGNSSIDWIDGEGQQRTGSYDMVYAVMPADADPCDVTKLDGPYPISHAPFHPGLGERYGFARYPFRDPEGNPITDGEKIRGTYPWIDRHGRNLFFPAIGATLHYVQDGTTRTRYTARCVPGVECELPPATPSSVEDAGRTRGVIAMGLWTRGKMVFLDGAFANTDYGLGQQATDHRELQLYDPFSAAAGDQSGWVRVGTGRDNIGAELPTQGVANTTFIDSLENLLNESPALVPATPRDVVWTLNSGRASADVAFDDYLHLDAVIVAEMNASATHVDPSYARNGGLMHYHDGFHETGSFAGTGFEEEVRIQNAATTTARGVPAYGLAHGNVRVEPAAVGGVVGKGLWLDGYAGVSFDLPEAITEDAFVSVFVDRRPDGEGLRRVLTFPGGSDLLLSRNRVRYRSAGVNYDATLPTAILAEDHQWTHLAVQLAGDGSEVQVWIDGFLRATLSPAPHTPLSSGELVLGALGGGGTGLRGWVDELVLIVDRPDPETICNHAHGTLVGFPASATGTWANIAAAYPSASHDAITARLSQAGEISYARYACFHDRDLDHGILAEDPPAGTSSVRTALLFPESPLVWNSPRPDSSSNEFCLDCHGVGEPEVLSLDALTPIATPMQQDPRRQPMQPLRLIGGWVPADHFGPGLPAAAHSSTTGLLADQWLYP